MGGMQNRDPQDKGLQNKVLQDKRFTGKASEIQAPPEAAWYYK